MRLPTLCLLCVVCSFPALQSAQADSKAPPTAPHERFDEEVRADFFDGMSGNDAKFQRAMNTCQRRLAHHPDDAQALVWHGTGLLWLSGQAFRSGKIPEGQRLWTKALEEMHKAKAIAPNDIAVLIPIGASLIGAGMRMPPNRAQGILAEGVAAYERTLEIQGSAFEQAGVHERCELLMGLAQGSARLNALGKARGYYQRVANECRDPDYPEYVSEAKAWLARKDGLVTQPHTCLGCHE